jgi:hypothetical protein
MRGGVRDRSLNNFTISPDRARRIRLIALGERFYECGHRSVRVLTLGNKLAEIPYGGVKTLPEAAFRI